MIDYLTITENAEEKKERYHLDCPVYKDFDDALALVKPDIVFDLTFPGLHYQITKKSLLAGCHVFGEKPMCMSPEEGKELIRISQETGKCFSVMQNRRFLPQIRALREAVQSGSLGTIWTIVCELYVESDLRSVRNQLPYPMLQDQAIHSFDSARFILGEDAVNVYCSSYNPPESHYNGPGSGTCVFQMKNGTVLVYNAVMDTKACRTSWHSAWRVIGSKGTAIWDSFEDDPAYVEMVNEECTNIVAADGKASELVTRMQLNPPGDWNGIRWFTGAVDEMLTALKEGQKSIDDCSENYGSVAMTFASIESIKTGVKVPVV